MLLEETWGCSVFLMELLTQEKCEVHGISMSRGSNYRCVACKTVWVSVTQLLTLYQLQMIQFAWLDITHMLNISADQTLAPRSLISEDASFDSNSNREQSKARPGKGLLSNRPYS